MIVNVVTVAHDRFDIRIWHKQIKTLVRESYKVRYFVSDGLGSKFFEGVEIIDLGIEKRRGAYNRLKFMFDFFNKLNMKKGDVVHFHDGIFLVFALMLAFKGCKVIYDVHEDYSSQVLNTRFSIAVRLIWSRSMWLMEKLADKLFYRIVAATPHIASKFNPEKSCVVNNYPMVSELSVINSRSFENRSLNLVYMGGVSRIRGIFQVLDALVILNKDIECSLDLAGVFDSVETQNLVTNHEGWKYVRFHGWADRQGVARILSSARLGLVIFHPSPNHINAQPNKLFEYMSAGLPVIASDFLLWKDIIESAKCGLVVNPTCSNSIAQAIKQIISDPKEAQKMGESGRQAVLEKYNWGTEKESLLKMYKELEATGVRG